jgi:agmatine deiminase
VTAPGEAGFRQPAEWEPHEGTFLAWPSAADLWLDNLEPAQRELAGLAQAIAEGEELRVLVPDPASEAAAKAALGSLPVRWHRIPFGDIWLRDIAPIFMIDDRGRRASAVFRFNGWGGKYVLPFDDRVAESIAKDVGFPEFRADFVLEGGSVEVDGRGTLLTTRQCLLNPNRNPGMSQASLEAELSRWFGAERILWLGDGLQNDHTDGHIDTIVRFVRPGLAVCMEPVPGDPNRDALLAIMRDLERMKLDVATVPSPGTVLSSEGELMPASYVNFYIADRTVIVPQYGVANDERALEAIAPLFPGRRIAGVSAKAILEGGGAFHCITQQLPRGGDR